MLYMKLLFRIIFLTIVAEIVFPVFVPAQTDEAKELKEKLQQYQKHQNLTDSNYASTLIDLAFLYTTSYPDSAILLLEGNANRCKAAGYKKGEINTYIMLGDAYETKGMYQTAMDNYHKSLMLAEKNTSCIYCCAYSKQDRHHIFQPGKLPGSINQVL